MSDLTSLREFVLDTETDFQSALSEPLYQKLGGIVNFLIDSIADGYKVGDLAYSAINQAQTDAIFGANVFLFCNGQSCVGTDYETLTGNSTVPDIEGQFLRGFDDGRGVDSGRALNTVQADQNLSHNHILANSILANNTTLTASSFVSAVLNDGSFVQGTNQNLFSRYFSGDDGITEGRPKNVASYLYVRVN